ncbi:MAG TPA: O-antigen ligase family protein [Allosphingosinicella sp.]|nr:O-antigen ligase family protein [Allosphingosinicella sp.]
MQTRHAIVPAYLLLCLLLGGASAAGIWGNMMLQILALPIIAAAVLTSPSTPVPAPGRQLIALLLAAVAVVAMQLVPLPPSIWTGIAGREAIAEGFTAVGAELPWLTTSLSPYRTVSSALWLLPAVAILLAILRLRAFKPGPIAWTIVAVTVVSVAIGAMQVAGGETSGWYFYEITNRGASTGFFSNANHLATLLVCTFPFLTALYLHARDKGRSVQKNSGLLVILVGAVGLVVVGVAVNRSLAGVGLSVPVLAASALMFMSRRGRPMPRWLLALVPILAVASVAVALSGPTGNNLIGEEARSSQESRFTSFSRSLDAAGDFLPAGSGIGSFQEIYRTRENPETMTRTYMNHVHSDYIELLLETGVPGMIVLALFLYWWARRTWAIWRAEDRDHYALAGSIASAAILAHSAVDYPLRTAAIAAVFALSVALMAEPRPAGRARREGSESGKPGARHLSAD